MSRYLWKAAVRAVIPKTLPACFIVHPSLEAHNVTLSLGQCFMCCLLGSHDR